MQGTYEKEADMGLQLLVCESCPPRSQRRHIMGWQNHQNEDLKRYLPGSDWRAKSPEPLPYQMVTQPQAASGEHSSLIIGKEGKAPHSDTNSQVNSPEKPTCPPSPSLSHTLFHLLSSCTGCCAMHWGYTAVMPHSLLIAM